MNIVKRIIQIAEYKNLSMNKLSIMIGVSNAYFSKQLKNDANVGSHIIEKIVSLFPDINTHWLITGEGDMIQGEKREESKEAAKKDCRHIEDIIEEQKQQISSLIEQNKLLLEQNRLFMEQIASQKQEKNKKIH